MVTTPRLACQESVGPNPAGRRTRNRSDSMVRELSMVLSQGLYEKFERERQKLREEGFQQGLEEVRKEWEAWYQLRLEAKERGEPFDVPPPTKDKHGHVTEADPQGSVGPNPAGRRTQDRPGSMVRELIMVLSQGLYEKFERNREKLREEGAQKNQQKWEAWNQLRLEAAERGETFDVPPPTLEDRE